MAASDPDYIKIVKEDFGVLSQSYDKINNFMSLGVDQQFRYIAIKNLYPEDIQTNLITFVDVGTGTGHLANEMFKQKPGCFIIGLDVSLDMLGFTKKRDIYKAGCMNIVIGDASKTPVRNGGIDGLFSGFVGRHYTDYPTTISEHNRIIREKGRIMMLEMGRRATPLSILIDVYVGKIMSTLGKLASYIITKGSAPFRLLEETYNKYYSPNELLEYYNQAGFKSRYKLVLMGSIVVILGYRTPDGD